jgi:hypothetical protein
VVTPLDKVDPAQDQKIIRALPEADIRAHGPDQGLDMERHVDRLVFQNGMGFIDHRLALVGIEFLLDQGQQSVDARVGIAAEVPAMKKPNVIVPT